MFIFRRIGMFWRNHSHVTSGSLTVRASEYLPNCARAVRIRHQEQPSSPLMLYQYLPPWQKPLPTTVRRCTPPPNAHTNRVHHHSCSSAPLLPPFHYPPPPIRAISNDTLTTHTKEGAQKSLLPVLSDERRLPLAGGYAVRGGSGLRGVRSRHPKPPTPGVLKPQQQQRKPLGGGGEGPQRGDLRHLRRLGGPASEWRE